MFCARCIVSIGLVSFVTAGVALASPTKINLWMHNNSWADKTVPPPDFFYRDGEDLRQTDSVEQAFGGLGYSSCMALEREGNSKLSTEVMLIDLQYFDYSQWRVLGPSKLVCDGKNLKHLDPPAAAATAASWRQALAVLRGANFSKEAALSYVRARGYQIANESECGNLLTSPNSNPMSFDVPVCVAQNALIGKTFLVELASKLGLGPLANGVGVVLQDYYSASTALTSALASLLAVTRTPRGGWPSFLKPDEVSVNNPFKGSCKFQYVGLRGANYGVQPFLGDAKFRLSCSAATGDVFQDGASQGATTWTVALDTVQRSDTAAYPIRKNVRIARIVGAAPVRYSPDDPNSEIILWNDGSPRDIRNRAGQQIPLQAGRTVEVVRTSIPRSRVTVNAPPGGSGCLAVSNEFILSVTRSQPVQPGGSPSCDLHLDLHPNLQIMIDDIRTTGGVIPHGNGSDVGDANVSSCTDPELAQMVFVVRIHTQSKDAALCPSS